MDIMILKPVLKNLVMNPPPLEVWINLFKYSLSRLKPTLEMNHAPLSVVVYVSKRCNFKCAFCFTYDDLNKADWQEYELTGQGFEQLLNSEFGKKSLRVGLLGGEPFMNPFIFDFLEKAHSRGKITTVVTNASLVDEDKRQKLEKIFPTMLGISLYDNNMEDVASLSRWAGQRKKNFWVQSVVNAEQLYEIKNKILFAKQNQIKNLILSNYHPSFSGEESKVIFSDNQELPGIFSEARLLAKRLGITLTLPNPIDRSYKNRSCSMPFNYIHVDAKGFVGPCCFRAPSINFGSIYEPSSWNNSAHKEIRKPFIDAMAPPYKECAFCENFGRDLYRI